jgi:hypothetical protein
MRRESPFRPLGSVLEAREAEKSFLDARSAGTWLRAIVGIIEAIIALRMKGVKGSAVVVIERNLFGFWDAI